MQTVGQQCDVVTHPYKEVVTHQKVFVQNVKMVNHQNSYYAKQKFSY